MQAKTIKASEFKTKCLQLMDEVNQSGKEIIIIKNGKPVSKLVPYNTKPDTLFGAHQHQIVIHGDIILGSLFADDLCDIFTIHLAIYP